MNNSKKRTKDDIKQYQKEYRAKNQEKIKAYRKEYRKLNPDKLRETSKVYRETDNYKKTMKEFREKNKDALVEYSKEYYNKNKDNILKRVREYNKTDHAKKVRRKYVSYKTQTDLCFKLKDRIRSRINKAIKRNSKSSKSTELTGCTIQELKIYIEGKFQKGMSWENYAYDTWHIDHIRPCASFDLSDPEQQKLCFHYTNLQPLWAYENLSKSDKYDLN